MARTKMARVALAGYLFLLPNLLGFLAFMLIPVVASLGLSFFEWDLFSPPKLVGLHNFSTLLHDHDFWRYAFNTVFLMLMIPVNILGSLFLAMVMNQKLRGIVVFRTIYFLPTIVMGVINSIITHWLPRWLNDGIRGLGVEWPPQWLASVTWAKPALMFMTFWTVVGGYNMILFLAALQGVSPELYEAADIDGANWWQKFRAITWPLVSPTTFSFSR